jgi:cold shock CspA family protein
MKTKIISVTASFMAAISVFAAQPSSNLNPEQALQKADRQFFIENKGQWHSDVLYLSRMGGLDVWITKYGVNYTFYQIEKNPNAKEAERLPNKFDHEMEDATLLGHRVILKFQNHKASPLPEGIQKQEGYYNYLIGNDPSKHASYVGLYKEAVVKNVYEGIDLRYYFDKGYLRYDFIVQPGADPAQIRFTLEGEEKEYLKNGALCYTTRFGEVQMQDLYVYQQNDKRQVQAKFAQRNGAWQFQFSGYDKTQPLIIDPLIYSTYIGGSGIDSGLSIAIDNTGNAYVTGGTFSSNYGITPGAFQTAYEGGQSDVFVTKLNNTGKTLLYSTYVGGSGTDIGCSIAIDNYGNAYITGHTQSTNYDISPGVFQTTYGGGLYDVFVTKLNSTGTALIYSTYIGGSNDDYCNSIAIDGSGNAYIAGYTASSDYPITPGAFQTTYGGGQHDVFGTKLNSTGTALLYSTYVGGAGIDYGLSIAIDNSGYAYITGYTNSFNYPITTGALQTDYVGGISDVFVTQLNSTGTGLIYSTYIGGSDWDMGLGIAIDGSGNAYIIGSTGSIDYDITPGAFQTTHGGDGDVFVTKLNSTGTALIYSTLVGGSGTDRGMAISIDSFGNAYITGLTGSIDYDITLDAFQTANGGNEDVFVTILNSMGTALIYSTYIGGSDKDEAKGIVIDNSGNVYFTGWTNSNNYNITSGAFQTVNGGGLSDVFVTKLDFVTTGVETLAHNQTLFSIFPNPNKGTFTIQSTKGGVFELLDVTGKVINTYWITNSQQTIHENLPAGLYFVREIESGAIQKLGVQ